MRISSIAMAATPSSMSCKLPRSRFDSLNDSNSDKRGLGTGWNLFARHRLDSPTNTSDVNDTSTVRINQWSQPKHQFDSMTESNVSAGCDSETSQEMDGLFSSSVDIFVGEPHAYFDHAGDDSSTSSDAGYRRPGNVPPFPVRLHAMLEEAEDDGLADIVSWQPHGRCFVVHKPKEFAEEIMPGYFKMSKFASFLRQLNLYGFTRLTRKGPDRTGYYHQLFLRGKAPLAYRIPRRRIKGNRVRDRSHPESEPDFYDMPSIADEAMKKMHAPSQTQSSVFCEEDSHVLEVQANNPSHWDADVVVRSSPCVPIHSTDVPILFSDKLSADEMGAFMKILKIAPNDVDDINMSVENDFEFADMMTRLCDSESQVG